jgi:hypothetical protein
MTGPIVLKLLRESAGQWWWFRELRKQGRVDEAKRLERESIRRTIHTMRTCKIESWSERHGYIAFERPQVSDPVGNTVSISNVPVGEFAAWLYVYAHKLGAQK